LRRRSARTAPIPRSNAAASEPPVAATLQPPPPPPEAPLPPSCDPLEDPLLPELLPVDDPELPELPDDVPPELPLLLEEPLLDPELPDPLPLLLLDDPLPLAPLLLLLPAPESTFVPLELPLPEPPSSGGVPVLHVWMLKKTLVVPPSGVVAGPPPPLDPWQTPPSPHARPMSAGGQYVPPRNSQIPQVYGVPVPPPELLLLLELPPDPLSIAGPASNAHPLGSSQHVASMQVSDPPHVWPMLATGQRSPTAAEAVRVMARPKTARSVARFVRVMTRVYEHSSGHAGNPRNVGGQGGSGPPPAPGAA
jgi:hypothetical protein